ncbi:unnamed protein product [Effrenium voratum]|uniref:HEAT repeat-containing protein n=1 Tax=Effrenium voratum TaxID=2562239 RepID=A0AA36N952_9DINO|nr:unnamed protein product [Effrenium voratum]
MADVDERRLVRRTPEFFMPCLRQGAAGLLPLHLQPNPCNMEVRIQLERSGLAFLRLASDRLADRRQDFGGEMAVEEPPVTMVDAFEELPTGLSELSVRRQSLQKLERVLVQQVDSLATDIIDAVMDALLKPLLKRLKDRSEKCRELAVQILRSLVENTSDLAAALPYIFPSLVARLGSEDLDGVAHLPEVMRPDPEQKPMEIAQPVEDSEEVRLQLGRFVAALLGRCSPTQVYSYVDEATGLIRAAAMDPFHEVKALACETMVAFCCNHTEMLLHFALPMARSLTSCLTHNHAKIRMAALRAITACLFCGVWKHNFEIFQVLMAWQDPNKVPIKAFYEGVTNVNYMSTLSFDRHPAVRRFWFETLGYWMLRCTDKVDLEPYIAPYLLTGLCDENEEIALEVFWLIEKIGEAYEEEHESDLRKTKQYGFDYSWTYQGRAFVPFPLQGLWGGGKAEAASARRGFRGPDLLGTKAEEEEVDEGLGPALDLPSREYCWPDFRGLEVFRRLPRPRLGSRSWVRTHSRRYIKATFNDVVDFRDCTALNAGRLLCMSVAYTEEGVTEWLQPMLGALTKFYSGRAWAAKDARAMGTYSCVCKLLGAFLEPSALWAQLQPALSSDSTLELDQRVAGVRILAMCLEGHVAVLQSVQPPDPSLGLGQLAPVLPQLIEEVHASDLLLSPTPESREAMWMLLFSFLEPLGQHLGQFSGKLLFVALALASKMKAEREAEQAAEHAAVEVEGGVPAVITRALRQAKGEVNNHVQVLQEAMREAEQAKEASTVAITHKETLVTKITKKTTIISQHAERTRNLMMAVEKAATQKAAQASQLQSTMTNWDGLSHDVEGLRKNISAKEQALTQIVNTLKKQIEKMKDQLDRKVTERDAKEAEMQELKGQAMSSAEFHKGVEQDQAVAEQAMQDDKRALSELQSELDIANTAATQAEAAEAAADDKVREARTNHDFGASTANLLQKIVDAVNSFYAAGDALEEAVDHPEGYKTIATTPELKDLFTKYNLMVSAFSALHAFDVGTYQLIHRAIAQIEENSMAALHLACDSTSTLEPEELEAKCGDNLWTAVELTQLHFPEGS